MQDSCYKGNVLKKEFWGNILNIYFICNSQKGP